MSAVDGVPKYVTVRDNLRQRAKAMSEGERLPAEPELCKQYNVSRITLRHAISDIIQEGLLVREQGRGTFRTSATTETGREVISDHIRGFYRQQLELGNIVRTEVLDNREVQNKEIALRLGLGAQEPLQRLERLRFVGSNLNQHVVTYLSARRFEKIAEHDFSSGSLYAFLEEQYAVHLVENEVVVRLVTADEKLAAMFSVNSGDTLLGMESVVADEFGTVIAVGYSTNAPQYSEVKFVVHSQKIMGPVQ